MIPEAISAALRVLPDAPGVYLFSDADLKIMYVGKASHLTHRVRSYWHTYTTTGAHRIRDALDQVASLEWTVTDSVKEALLLEATLIRKHLPRF
ncbi:MAG: nucleotide excision repair endonuclease, partial [Candidatus Limnocylindrus sp.]